MFWLLTRLVVWPTKAVAGSAKLAGKATTKTAAGSFKAGYRTGRILGYRRMTVLAAGVGVGLLVAPRPGRDTRQLVRQRLVERGLLSPPSPDSALFESPSPVPDLAAATTSNGQGTTSPTSVAASPGADPIEALPEDPGASPS